MSEGGSKIKLKLPIKFRGNSSTPPPPQPTASVQAPSSAPSVGAPQPVSKLVVKVSRTTFSGVQGQSTSNRDTSPAPSGGTTMSGPLSQGNPAGRSHLAPRNATPPKGFINSPTPRRTPPPNQVRSPSVEVSNGVGMTGRSLGTQPWRASVSQSSLAKTSDGLDKHDRRRRAKRARDDEDYVYEDDDDDDSWEPGSSRGKSQRSDTTAHRGGRSARSVHDGDFVDDLEDDDDYFGMKKATGVTDADFSRLQLKPDNMNRPLWVCPDGRIFLETYSPVYKQAYDFLIAISEPVCRPESVHEYVLTPHSLYAAVSIGLETNTIITVLDRLSKVYLPNEIKKFIRSSTENYGKVKLVLKHNKFYVESEDARVLKILMNDPVISRARVLSGPGETGLVRSKALKEQAAAELAAAIDLSDETEELPDVADMRAKTALPEVVPQEDSAKEVLAFEILPEQVEHVKQRCLPGGLNYPMLEEYDFKNDTQNPDLDMELKPHVSLRPYQEKSLSKMFGNGRARSGIIVLPCGAGKSLVGVAATCRVKKSCLCLVTSSVSVDQWRHQYKLWTNLRDDQITRFTSENKEAITAPATVTITTFNMIAFSGSRSAESEAVMETIKNREWGLIVMDEVHVVPAQMFRKVISIVKAHCKLGLTATLVREDERIGDLNFLIGPKLYEANWLDLTRAGHIANVQCAEVWCPMTKEFFREYLKKENVNHRQLLYVLNPNKFIATQFLIDFHANRRGDKVIVFSDNIFALKEYAVAMKKPYIYGPTSHAERTRVLHAFKHNPQVNCVFLSKVGDNSLDIPEANVLIQISSHAGSRRQEAQRLGRILRAKRGKGATGEEEFNAFFYTLVSTDTQEMFYSTKRQQFLIDQGYSFKVVTNLTEVASQMEGIMYRDTKEQLNLLTKILTSKDEDNAVETFVEDADNLVIRQKGASRRLVGNMSALSGGAGLTYLEYKTGGKRKDSEKTKKMRRSLMAS